MPAFIPAPVLTPQPIDLITPITYGRTSGDLSGHAVTGGLTLSLPFLPQTMGVVADANALSGFAQGGHNTLTGFAQEAIGDAVTVTGHAQVGHNTEAINGSLGPAVAIGDAFTLTGNAQGGYNSVSSVARGGQAAIGDAVFMFGHAQGGHNYVTGGARIQTYLYGDAVFMSGAASGGHNTLVGAENNASVMFGDAFELSGQAHGGGNLLIGAPDLTAGGPAFNLMFGDGYELLGHASGGGNTLVSGDSTDIMWGDAAIVSPTAQTSADTFEFMPHNGYDQIMDFHPGDHIDLEGFGFSSFGQLAADFQQTAYGALISFDANDSILVVGVNQLSPSDFIFT